MFLEISNDRTGRSESLSNTVILFAFLPLCTTISSLVRLFQHMSFEWSSGYGSDTAVRSPVSGSIFTILVRWSSECE